ncbi:fimbrial protein [Enterobacter bugandensis]|uniref:fimbrial protein n=1 Tax=Enterobacter bugandensis TaxID=881260 RepID=UPI0022E74429|nr:fimbrial protein [Enterobacter bugandensis]
MNTSLSAALLFYALTSAASAATYGHGHVEIQGSIIDTACAIATGDADQSIEIGTIPVSELANNGRSPSVPFTIQLVNCVLNGSHDSGHEHWKDVRIVFDGESDGPGLFALHGAAQGEALIIADEAGTRAEPGVAINAESIMPGTMELHYRMWLTGDHSALQPGDIHTTVRYFMEYD